MDLVNLLEAACVALDFTGDSVKNTSNVSGTKHTSKNLLIKAKAAFK